MNESSFTAHGDAALEARIVAWVRGEASAFEAAELERLCHERPELMVFKRRIATLHGMLAEAENAKPHEAWKLPQGKRKGVDEHFGKQDAAAFEDAREKRVKHSGYRALPAIAACLALLVVIAGLSAPALMKHRRKSNVAAARSDDVPPMRLALMESPENMERLRSDRPAGLIEGSAQPMNVPDSEVAMDDPAGPEFRGLAARGRSAENKDAPSPSASLRSKAMAAMPVPPTDRPLADVAVAEPMLEIGEIDMAAAKDGGAGGGGLDDAAQLAAKGESAGLAPRRPLLFRNSRTDEPTDEFGEGNRSLASRADGAASPVPRAMPAEMGLAQRKEPYSTFTLNISDASFRIALAALASGAQPDPAGIKVEQFYNAVDYGDPAPASNEPVACAIEQAAHPLIAGRNLVRVALMTAAAGRPATQPLRLTLLVDQSGSMSRADRRAAMNKALDGLAGLLTKDDLVSVIGFSRPPRLLADGLTGDQAGKLADLVHQAASGGGTNLQEVIKLAEPLALRHMQPGAQNRIVLFTDGAANPGDANPDRLAEKVRELRQKGLAIDIAGILAGDLNDALLGELARNGNGRYYLIGNDDDDNFAKRLAGAFRPAAENVKVQVRFNPQRVARYKLIGFEKDRLKTGDFRNDKQDAAEIATEEAGVAIYQVEPLADGRGEIGEVNVRFRDTATGETVERSWTIPHDPAAPALDRATPSMQLATLAMLAAEKLKGGPLGEAVDFRQFAAAQADVKAHYSGDPRVAGLLRMIGMLK